MKTIHLCLLLAVLPTFRVDAAGLPALEVLRDNCLRCHGEDKRKGGLALHSRAALLAGGDSGPAMVVGKPGESSLLQLLAADADPHMPPKKQLTPAEVSAVRDWIASGAQWDEDALRALPVREVKRWAMLPVVYRPVGALAVSADGKRLAVARGDRIQLYEFGEKEAKAGAVLAGHRDAVQSLAWSPDGALLVSGGYRSAKVWNAVDGKLVKELKNEFAGRITGLIFTKDGGQLVAADSVASIGAQLHVVATKDWRTVKRIRAHADAVYDLTLSPGGKLLASASADKLVKLWSTVDWTSPGALEGHTDYALAAAFDPEGERIATGSADATIKVWKVATRKQISTFSDRKSELAITGLHWRRNPAAKKDKNDDWIISVSEDGTPRLYTDLVVHDGAQRSTGARMKAWPGVDAGLSVMDWNGESGRLLAGDTVGGVTIWDEQGKIAERIEAR